MQRDVTASPLSTSPFSAIALTLRRSRYFVAAPSRRFSPRYRRLSEDATMPFTPRHAPATTSSFRFAPPPPMPTPVDAGENYLTFADHAARLRHYLRDVSPRANIC
jgi:hypothetical protein